MLDEVLDVARDGFRAAMDDDLTCLERWAALSTSCVS